MKPMIKYRGGKSREIPRIMWHIPRFSGRYIEPFFGGGALFFHLEPKQAIINDINGKLMGFYRGVRNNYHILRQELDMIEKIYADNRREFDNLKKLYPNERIEDKNEEMYYRIRSMYNGLLEKSYSDASLYYYINKTAYSGMIRYNTQGEFNVPFGRYQHLNTDLVSLSHSLLLQKAELYNVDYSEIFKMCKSDDFVFLDPPYDCIFSDYGNEEYKDGFNELNHRQLAEDFKNLPCKALMVIGKTPLTESLYQGYIVEEYDKSYSVNIRNRFRAVAKHIIVTNYRKCWEDATQLPALYDMTQGPETNDLRLFDAEEHYGTY